MLAPTTITEVDLRICCEGSGQAGRWADKQAGRQAGNHNAGSRQAGRQLGKQAGTQTHLRQYNNRTQALGVGLGEALCIHNNGRIQD